MSKPPNPGTLKLASELGILSCLSLRAGVNLAKSNSSSWLRLNASKYKMSVPSISEISQLMSIPPARSPLIIPYTTRIPPAKMGLRNQRAKLPRCESITELNFHVMLLIFTTIKNVSLKGVTSTLVLNVISVSKVAQYSYSASGRGSLLQLIFTEILAAN